MSTSRIGKLPIAIPKGVMITVDNGILKVKGPKGELEKKCVGNIEVKIEGNELSFSTLDEERKTKAFHGLMRALTNNMVIGVTDGFTRKLRIVGVGYRGEGKGDTLVLNVGYSNPVEFNFPRGSPAR